MSSITRMFFILLPVLAAAIPACAPAERVPVRSNVRSMIASVPPGTARRVTFAHKFGDQFAPNGSDLFDLMEVQGASYIVKAPACAGEGFHIEYDVRQFNRGKAVPLLSEDPDRAFHQSPSTSRVWLVDIITWPDWFSSKGYVCRMRVTPLDGGNWQGSAEGFFPILDADNKAATQPMLTSSLYQVWSREVSLEKDVPLACLAQGPFDKDYKPSAVCGGEDPEQMGRAATGACVFYIRLCRNENATAPAGAAGATGPAKAQPMSQPSARK